MSDVLDHRPILEIEEADPGPPPEPPPGPIAQSVAIGFRAVYVVTLLLAVIWLGSNIRQISPDTQAVVLRFDRIVRVQNSGLLLAWPRPIEQVILLPGPDRQLSQSVGSLPPVGGITQAPQQDIASEITVPVTVSPYLTGDGNVVLLDAKLIYRIVDPRAYFLSEVHIGPALDRLFRSTAVQVTAGFGLNDFLVAQTATTDAARNQSVVALRAAVRDDFSKVMNAKLAGLADKGVSLGVEVDRIDLTPSLPPEAKVAFDQVLTASQRADQQVAAARTAGELRRQGAQREADRLKSAAEATANETVTSATVDTATIKALIGEETNQTRANVMLHAYTDKASEIMNRIGSVTAVDPQGGARIVLPGK
jgi:regulator of protease activity HflC (stomatin/prohibitin superfamily)